MSLSQSLFDARGEPTVSSATDWVAGVLFGEVATILCVIAVAFIGFTMLTGRLPVNQAFRVIIGAFVLLGAPVIASTFSGLADQADAPTRIES